MFKIQDDEALPVQLEYTSSPEVYPYKGLTPPWGLCPFLRKTACKEFSYTRDALEDVSVKALPMLYEFFKEKGVRGGIGCPVVDRDELTNVLVLHTSEPRDWQEDELALVHYAAHQIANYLQDREEQSKANA
jgi:GAF domain-containing protein